MRDLETIILLENCPAAGLSILLENYPAAGLRILCSVSSRKNSWEEIVPRIF